MLCFPSRKACERFIKDEECFWQCEPNLIKWHTKGGALEGVPICSKYCDEWFDACKDDMTCAQDWLNGFNFTSNVYSCPTSSSCRTFSEVTLIKLTNRMWFSVVCSLIDNDMRHHSGQNVVDSRGACFITISTSKKMFLRAEKGIG